MQSSLQESGLSLGFHLKSHPSLTFSSSFISFPQPITGLSREPFLVKSLARNVWLWVCFGENRISAGLGRLMRLQLDANLITIRFLHLLHSDEKCASSTAHGSPQTPISLLYHCSRPKVLQQLEPSVQDALKGSNSFITELQPIRHVHSPILSSHCFKYILLGPFYSGGN